MKKLVYFALAIIFAASCSDRKVCHIEGRIDPEQYRDSCWIYLVPEGPHEHSDVDSCLVHDWGKFSFTRKKEEMAIIRLQIGARAGLQELLVVTEPGTLDVFIGADSHCSGTVQNDSLQAWKVMTVAHMSQPYDEFTACHDEYKQRTQQMAIACGEESTIGKFLLKLYPIITEPAE